MKKLFVSVLAIAGLVACNNEETLVQQGPAAIEFEASHVEKATRVDPSITTETLAGFDVWAYMDSKEGKVLFDEDVTKNGGKWGYADTQYWMPGHHYSFTAIAPMNSDNWDYAYEADTIAFTNVDGTEDLLLALAEADTDANNAVDYDYKTVKLTFDHLLSKTKFTFKNGFTSEFVTVEVKDVKMTADAKAATYDVNARAWGESAGEVVLAYGNVPVMTAGVKNEATDERLTIPAVEKEYTVEFDIYVYQGENAGIEKFHKTSTIENVVLEQGKAYNFVATISPETLGLDEIEFEVIEVNEWIYAGEDAGEIEEAELKAALQLGGEVVLAKNYEITSPLYVTENVTLNLNGYAISNKVDNAATDVIVVAEGATLTIEGEGTIEAVSGNDGFAIIADGTVVINGGTFKAGKDENGEANAVVYVRGEGKAFVNGGYFPNENATNYVLNKRDADKATTVIEVRGGKFVGFDPANSPSEYPAENFVAEGYYSNEVEANVFVVSDGYAVATAAQLQTALDNKVETIRFCANIEGGVKVSQQEGVNYTIDGAGFKYDGTIEVVGNNRNNGAETLTIENIAFETTRASVYFINSNDQTAPGRYSHNVTVKNCTFKGDYTTVGARFRQAYNIAFVNCESEGMHSLFQGYGVTGVSFDGVNINGKNGISLGSSINAVIRNSNIVADAYGVRADAATTTTLVENTVIEAVQPIIVRKLTAGEYTVAVNGGELKTSADYDVVFTNDDDSAAYVAPEGAYKFVCAKEYRVFPL